MREAECCPEARPSEPESTACVSILATRELLPAGARAVPGLPGARTIASVPTGQRLGPLAWSRTSGTLCYSVTRKQGEWAYLGKLLVWRRDTGSTSTVMDWTQGGLTATWHPDGRRLAVIAHEYKPDPTHGQCSLWFLGQSGRSWTAKRIRVLPGSMLLGGWSQDGRQFVYSWGPNRGEGRPHFTSRVYLCQGDGSRPRPLSPPGVVDYAPNFVP